MKKTILCILLAVATIFAEDDSPNIRKIIHFIDIPLIEASGIYTGVSLLKHGEESYSKASAITGLSLLGVQATFGTLMLTKLGKEGMTIRKAHRITSFVLTAASVAMAASASVDKGTKGTTSQVTSYLFTGTLLVPVIMFSF